MWRRIFIHVMCVIHICCIMMVGCDRKPEEPVPTETTKASTPTPTPSPTPEPKEKYYGPDFAKKAEITVEGYEEGPEPRPKELMVDGDPYTRWAFKRFPTDVIFDFGAPFILSKAHFTWLETGRIYYYELYASYDGDDWVLLADRSNNDEGYNTTDSFDGFYGKYVKITMLDNEVQNGWAAINEVDIDGFRFVDSPYKIDIQERIIEIEEEVSKEIFIENCNLDGLYEAKVETDKEKVSDGDVLKVLCGDVEFEYTIKIK